jgi:hypothetical protein
MGKRIKIKLANDLHGTKTSIMPTLIKDGEYQGMYGVTFKSARACKLRLCPHPFGCECGDFFGARQGHVEVITQDLDGNFIINKDASVDA